jgi:two-component system, NarL family, response regulator DesR
MLVDDHPAVRDAVSKYLDLHGVRLVGTAENGDQAVRLAGKSNPDVVVLDLALPDVPGISVARQLTKQGERVVVYTGRLELSDFQAALGLGVRGFVMKDSPLDHLVRAVSAVGHGNSFIDPSLHAYVAGRPRTPNTPTARELEVLQLLADGVTIDEIAERLHVSASTVRAHTGSLVEKLAAKNRTNAVAIALRQSLIS